MNTLLPKAKDTPGFRDAKYLKSFREAPFCESCDKPNDGTIVGAHCPVGLKGGRGFKGPDALTAALCSDCHNIADGRTNATQAERLKIWVRVGQKLMRDRYRLWRDV